MNSCIKSIIGKIVTVTVDRPLGSTHPKNDDIHYTVNYGYINGIIAADGEEQDAYVLCVDHPLKTYTGRVIAIIHRLNDVEDKLVVVPDGVQLSEESIRNAVDFQEKYFDYQILL